MPPLTPSHPNGFSSNGTNAAQTIIARGVRVEGDFRSQGNVTIEGELVGSLTCGGHLTIGPEASIKATVTAEEATVSGSIEGNLIISKRLDLKMTAKIKGDILADAITIESGASLDGNCKVGGLKPASQPISMSSKPKELTINTPADAKSGATA